MFLLFSWFLNFNYLNAVYFFGYWYSHLRLVKMILKFIVCILYFILILIFNLLVLNIWFIDKVVKCFINKLVSFLTLDFTFNINAFIKLFNSYLWFLRFFFQFCTWTWWKLYISVLIFVFQWRNFRRRNFWIKITFKKRSFLFLFKFLFFVFKHIILNQRYIFYRIW